MGRPPIVDEFTALPVSRQRKWQLRRVQEGRCTTCGDALVVDNGLCLRHRVAMAETQRRFHGRRVGPSSGKWLQHSKEEVMRVAKKIVKKAAKKVAKRK